VSPRVKENKGEGEGDREEDGVGMCDMDQMEGEREGE
jgi:hypothetical protein